MAHQCRDHKDVFIQSLLRFTRPLIWHNDLHISSRYPSQRRGGECADHFHSVYRYCCMNGNRQRRLNFPIQLQPPANVTAYQALRALYIHRVSVLRMKTYHRYQGMEQLKKPAVLEDVEMTTTIISTLPLRPCRTPIPSPASTPCYPQLNESRRPPHGTRKDNIPGRQDGYAGTTLPLCFFFSIATKRRRAASQKTWNVRGISIALYTNSLTVGGT